MLLLHCCLHFWLLVLPLRLLFCRLLRRPLRLCRPLRFFWRPLRLFCRPLCPYRALLVLKHPLLFLCPLGMLLLHCCLHFWLLVLHLRLLFCRLLRLLFCLLLRRPLRRCRPLRFFLASFAACLSSFVSLSGSSCTKASFVVSLSFGDASSALLSSFLAAGFAFAASFLSPFAASFFVGFFVALPM